MCFCSRSNLIPTEINDNTIFFDDSMNFSMKITTEIREKIGKNNESNDNNIDSNSDMNITLLEALHIPENSSIVETNAAENEINIDFIANSPKSTAFPSLSNLQSAMVNPQSILSCFSDLSSFDMEDEQNTTSTFNENIENSIYCKSININKDIKETSDIKTENTIINNDKKQRECNITFAVKQLNIYQQKMLANVKVENSDSQLLNYENEPKIVAEIEEKQFVQSFISHSVIEYNEKMKYVLETTQKCVRSAVKTAVGYSLQEKQKRSHTIWWNNESNDNERRIRSQKNIINLQQNIKEMKENEVQCILDENRFKNIAIAKDILYKNQNLEIQKIDHYSMCNENKMNDILNKEIKSRILHQVQFQSAINNKLLIEKLHVNKIFNDVQVKKQKELELHLNSEMIIQQTYIKSVIEGYSELMNSFSSQNTCIQEEKSTIDFNKIEEHIFEEYSEYLSNCLNFDRNVHQEAQKCVSYIYEVWKSNISNQIESKLLEREIEKNIKKAIDLTFDEQQMRCQSLENHSMYSLCSITYEELNCISAIERCNREQQCIEFLNCIAEQYHAFLMKQKCNGKIKKRKACKLLNVWKKAKMKKNITRSHSQQPPYLPNIEHQTIAEKDSIPIATEKDLITAQLMYKPANSHLKIVSDVHRNGSRRLWHTQDVDWLLYAKCKNIVLQKHRFLLAIKSIHKNITNADAIRSTSNSKLSFNTKSTKNRITKKKRYLHRNVSKNRRRISYRIKTNNRKIRSKSVASHKNKTRFQDRKQYLKTPQAKKMIKNKRYYCPKKNCLKHNANEITIHSTDIESESTINSYQSSFSSFKKKIKKSEKIANAIKRLSRPKSSYNHISKNMKKNFLISNKYKNSKITIDDKIFSRLHFDAELRRKRNEIVCGLSLHAKDEHFHSVCTFQPKVRPKLGRDYSSAIVHSLFPTKCHVKCGIFGFDEYISEFKKQTDTEMSDDCARKRIFPGNIMTESISSLDSYLELDV